MDIRERIKQLDGKRVLVVIATNRVNIAVGGDLVWCDPWVNLDNLGAKAVSFHVDLVKDVQGNRIYLKDML